LIFWKRDQQDIRIQKKPKENGSKKGEKGEVREFRELNEGTGEVRKKKTGQGHTLKAAKLKAREFWVKSRGKTRQKGESKTGEVLERGNISSGQ